MQSMKYSSLNEISGIVWKLHNFKRFFLHFQHWLHYFNSSLLFWTLILITVRLTSLAWALFKQLTLYTDILLFWFMIFQIRAYESIFTQWKFAFFAITFFWFKFQGQDFNHIFTETFYKGKRKKKISKNLTFLPKYCIVLKMYKYVSTYAGPLKFSKPVLEQC